MRSASCRAQFVFRGMPNVFVLVLLASLLSWSACAVGHSRMFRPDAAITNDAQAIQWFDSLLQTSWQYYKQRFMKKSALKHSVKHSSAMGMRVESNNYGGTITEGQSYALLKSVWMNDPETFEATWRWTQEAMSRPEDHLFAWHWGKKTDGTWGVVSEETATDGDQDIAYALILASERWNRPEYLAEARLIMRDLWRINVKQIQGRFYLAPGTWTAFQEDYLTVNPSYLAPYVYRKFADVSEVAEQAKNWRALATDSYATLEICSNLTQNQLPPNWCSVDWKTGAIGWSDKQGDGARDFSYDAFRVFWRMAMDEAVDHSGGGGQALTYLRQHQALQAFWQEKGYLPEGFTESAEPRTDKLSGFSVSAMLAQDAVLHPEPKQMVKRYREVLAPYYHRYGYWFNDYNDFLHSVIWFHLYGVRQNLKAMHKGL